MVKIEDRCVVCPREIGCKGPGCPNRNVAVHYCDTCGEELDDVYEVEDKELCEDCLKELFRRR